MSAPTTLSLLFLKDIRMTYRHIPTAIILGLLIIGFTPLLWISLYFANVAANNVGQVLMVDNGNAVLKLRDTPFGYHLTGTEVVEVEAAELPVHRDKIIPADCPSELLESSMEEDRGRFPPYFEMEITSKRPEIEVSKLVKKWPNGELALKGVSLKAFRGQVTALLGPNGAGKSTIFGCLAGFIKPSAGIIRISGEPPGAASGITNIGYCPQWNPLFSYLTVSEHLNFYGSIKTGDNVVKDDVEEVLRLTDLTADRHRKVHNLTAGQKRKLSVGIALIGNCRVLLLDEPTAGMDLAGRKIMIDIIERVKTNKAVLLTTHYMDDADYLSDKIMIMAKGEMVCNGSVDFLRARFGTGIMMTIEFSQSSDEDDSNPGRFYRMAAEVLNAVLVHCDGARMDGPVGPRFNLILPHGSQRTFPDMFADLESRKEELCIEGFELRVNKLEQVFLKVTDVVDALKEDVVSIEEQVKQFIETLRYAHPRPSTMHGGHIGTPQGAKPHRYSAEARDDRLGGRASAAVNNELEAVREALRREKRRPSWKLAVTMAVIGLCIGFAAGAMFDNAFNECVDRSPGIKRAAIVGTDGSVWARSNGANEFRVTDYHHSIHFI
uniref:ABC transporter domain-containing protein n=1 Tax=Panagrellus redivivus TaxID=6233 RepID=A0A7E4W2C0_PANRE